MATLAQSARSTVNRGVVCLLLRERKVWNWNLRVIAQTRDMIPHNLLLCKAYLYDGEVVRMKMVERPLECAHAKPPLVASACFGGENFALKTLAARTTVTTYRSRKVVFRKIPQTKKIVLSTIIE